MFFIKIQTFTKKMYFR